MPSLTKIFGFAAVAFAAFASAAPTANVNSDIVARDCACAEPGVPSLPAILTTLKADVDVHVKALGLSLQFHLS
jgi:hypothetical protein